MTSDIQITVIWHTHDSYNKCFNDKDNSDRPCLFPPAVGDPNKYETVLGTVSVDDNAHVDAFLVSGWLVTNDGQTRNVTLSLGGPPVHAEFGQVAPPDTPTCAALTSQEPCGPKDSWFPFASRVSVNSSYNLSISWDNGRIIFDKIEAEATPSQPPEDPPAPVMQPIPGTNSSSVSSTTLSLSLTADTNTAHPSANTPADSTATTSYPSAPPGPASNDGPPVQPSAAAPARHHPSRARTIAPAVIVPVVFVVAGIVGYFLWRRRRRLARIAPSARFKGESPEMKPWLPLDVQRSASRQD